MPPDDTQAFDIDSMPVLVRRRIEAMVLGPMIRAFQAEFGAERTNQIASRVIREIALEQGRSMAQRAGDSDLKTYLTHKAPWSAGHALETEVIAKNEARYEYNVTRCRYAEMYRELGMADLGFIFSCGRDFNFPKGFNPNLKLRRSQTIMQGAPYCDFRYVLEDESPPGDA